MLRRVLDLPLIVILMGLVALIMLIPAAFGAVQRDHDQARPFFYGGLVLFGIVVMLAIATANRESRDPQRSRLAALVGAYLVLPVMLALPFQQALRDTSFLNAWFEMVSSLTTTGATLYEADRLSETLHLWRALVGWLGGLLVLVAAMAILAPLNLGGVEVMSGRVPGKRADLRAGDQADPVLRALMAIAPVYFALTMVLWLMLAIAGDTSFVALCHAMATLSTSGISPIGGLHMGQAGFTGEALVFLFLIFALTRRSLPGAGPLHGTVSLSDDRELRMGALIVAGVTLILLVWHSGGPAPDDAGGGLGQFFAVVWGAAFTALSYLTTTGFISAEWDQTRLWADLDSSALMLAGLALIGGGIATTTGGVKLLRLYALWHIGRRELERQVHPNSVGGIGHSGRSIRRNGAYLAWVFFVMFGISIFVTAALMAFFGTEFTPAVLMAVSALSTTGPLADQIGPESLPYAALESPQKVILAMAMITGRVETFALMALAAVDPWRD